MNFSNTLLVSDIDGTLIGADQQIPQANRDAIAQNSARVTDLLGLNVPSV